MVTSPRFKSRAMLVMAVLRKEIVRVEDHWFARMSRRAAINGTCSVSQHGFVANVEVNNGVVTRVFSEV